MCGNILKLFTGKTEQITSGAIIIKIRSSRKIILNTPYNYGVSLWFAKEALSKYVSKHHSDFHNLIQEL